MGKPLISDATMRGMYVTMQRMRLAKRSPEVVNGLSRTERAALQDEPESLLAALLSQLHRRDTVLVQGNAALLPTVIASSFPHGQPPSLETCTASTDECAAVAAGMALRIAQKPPASVQPSLGAATPPRPIIVALLHDLPPLAAVFRLMEQHELALLLIAGGEPESRADAQRRLLSTKVPVLPVDRADAVAVCRVLQESLLRARNGWGGAVIHAASMPGSTDALQLLRQHMQNRGLLAPST
ncbi:MAG: hypothetical protein ACRYGF_02325 [Janthinobacterium lividum]